MTTKDYKIIASAMNHARPKSEEDLLSLAKKQQWLRVLIAMTVAFRADNPRFNRDTFCAACRDETC